MLNAAKAPGAYVPSLGRPQHRGSLDGMQKKSDDIKMATVPSVTNLMRIHPDYRLNYHHPNTVVSLHEYSKLYFYQFYLADCITSMLKCTCLMPMNTRIVKKK